MATILSAQQAPAAAVAGAKLVVTSVSGPATAVHNQIISVTYKVENQGADASGSYSVGLYLSRDKKIDAAEDRLLEKVTFSTGLSPGQSKKKTAKVLLPSSGLSGNYYYGAVVEASNKASSKQVSLAGYSLAVSGDTVTRHKTGLVWQEVDDSQLRNWADATQFCKHLTFDGNSNWRLPSIDELEAIIDYSRVKPAIDGSFGAQWDRYWSGSSYFEDPLYAWSVDFANGGVFAYPKTEVFYARCVRGAGW
jgi:hypothetical protein